MYTEQRQVVWVYFCPYKCVCITPWIPVPSVYRCLFLHVDRSNMSSSWQNLSIHSQNMNQNSLVSLSLFIVLITCGSIWTMQLNLFLLTRFKPICMCLPVSPPLILMKFFCQLKSTWHEQKWWHGKVNKPEPGITKHLSYIRYKTICLNWWFDVWLQIPQLTAGDALY